MSRPAPSPSGQSADTSGDDVAGGLSSPAFRRLWAAQALSSLGDGLVLVAFPLLAMQLTSDPLLVAGVAVAQGAPWLLFSLAAGAVVDRVDRRRLMVAVDLLRAGVLLLFGLALAWGVGGLAALYVAAFLLTTGETLFASAAQAMTPQLVAARDLDRANGRVEGTQVIGQEFAGPVLGGLLFAVAAAAPFLVDAVTFAASAALLLTMARRLPAPPAPVEDQRPRSRLRREVAEGLRFVRHEPRLRALLALIAVAALLQGGVHALLALYARDVLGVPVAALGLVWAVAAGGDVLGSLVVSRVRQVLGAGRTVTVGLVLVGVAYLLLGVVSNIGLFTALLALCGLVVIVVNVVNKSLRQTLTPNHLLGRVSSVYRLANGSADALGALLAGLAARELGLRAPFLVAGVLQLAAVAVAVPALRRLGR